MQVFPDMLHTNFNSFVTGSAGEVPEALDFLVTNDSGETPWLMGVMRETGLKFTKLSTLKPVLLFRTLSSDGSAIVSSSLLPSAEPPLFSLSLGSPPSCTPSLVF